MWGWISGGKSGTVNLPVNVGEETGQCLAGRSVFKVYGGTSKTNSQPVSMFKFEVAPGTTAEHKAAAKAEFKRLRILRHPSVVKYIDGVDTDNMVVIVTEPVTPLLHHIQSEEGLSRNETCWGLYQTVTALKFLHEDCQVAHRNLYSSSVFVSNGGDWKLGGVGWCEATPQIPLPSRVNQYLSKYDPPEVLRGVTTSPLTTDVWLLGVLVWEIFNGNMSSPQALRDTSKMPVKLVAVYRELVGSNYKSRPNIGAVFDKLNGAGGYFDNGFVAANIFLNELTIKEAGEKQKFFAQLTEQLDTFPEPFCKHKILPALIQTFQYGDVGIDVLPPLFKLGKLLSETEYKDKIIPCVLKLFSSTDRAMRMQLLNQLDNFIEYLDNKTVDGQIFPAVATGFTDTVPGMREHTIKSMLLIAGRLSESTIDNILLKYLAKAQTDPEAPIRTNTTICISKIASHFSSSTKRKVLIPAFLRALKDPFLHARNAGLLSLGCTIQYYGEPEIATRILPSLCPLLMDTEKTVREQALKTVRIFVDKVERYNKGIPDPTPTDKPTNRSTEQPAADQQDPSKAGWTSWAVSSVSHLATRYSTQQTPNRIGEIQVKSEPKPEPAKPETPVKPEAVKPGSAEEQPCEEDEAGWDDDGWDDLKSPKSGKSVSSLPKTKSTMKLGSLKSHVDPDDEDDFVASILKEEQGRLKQQMKKSSSASLARPKSPEDDPAPWDVAKPLNSKVKLAPWDEPSNSGNKDVLSSYFSSTNDDFFGDMGVEEKTRGGSAGKEKSAWDDFNINTAESSDWGGDLAQARASPKSGADWMDQGDDWDDKWESKPSKSAPLSKPSRSVPSKQPAKPAANWDDDWGADPVPIKSSKPAFQPAQSSKPAFQPAQSSKPAFQPTKSSTSSKPAFQPAPSRTAVQPDTPDQPEVDDWGSGWADEPVAKGDKRRPHREKRGQRTRGGGLGGRKKD